MYASIPLTTSDPTLVRTYLLIVRAAFFTSLRNVAKDVMKVFHANPTNIYLFKVNNRNTRKRCEICSKLTIKTPERRH